VVVHEGRHVDALVTSQQEGEDVRLPQLVRLRALEAPFRRRHLRHLGRLVRQQALVVKDAADLRLGHADGLEAAKAVGNLARTEVSEGLLHRDDGVASGVRHFRLWLRAWLLHAEPLLAKPPVHLHPVVHRVRVHAEHPRHLARRQVFFRHCRHDSQFELWCMAPAICATVSSSLRRCFPSHCVTPAGSACCSGWEGDAKGFGANSDAHQLARTTSIAACAIALTNCGSGSFETSKGAGGAAGGRSAATCGSHDGAGKQ
jgi:hypothetical protein